MRVCYFGPYNPSHPRSRAFIKGLRKNGIEVIECNSISPNRLLDYIRLLNRHRSLDYDCIILGARGDYYGQPLVPFIRQMTRRPVMFDAVLTLYETQVIDRKLVSENSLKAKFFYLLDRFALLDSDLILTDTMAHAEYYSSEYHINISKFKRIFVSADDDVYYPRMEEKQDDFFLVMFWGGFIPLHGTEYIIKAAKLLETDKKILFEVRGTGQTYNDILTLSKDLGTRNVVFVPEWVPYEELPQHIAKADVCLGIFGETQKAQRVIPTKAVEALAMKKPLITGDSPAAREVLEDRKNCILVPMANSKALAEAILMLRGDKKLRDEIAEKGYELFKEKLSPEAIGKELKLVLSRLIEKGR